MGKIYDGIEPALAAWIVQQPMFFVGTAPSGGDGHVNVSPKGPIGSLRLLDERNAGLSRPGRQRRRDGRPPAAERAHRGDAVRASPARRGSCACTVAARCWTADALEFPDVDVLARAAPHGDPRRGRPGGRLVRLRRATDGVRRRAPQLPDVGRGQAAQAGPGRPARVRRGAQRREHRWAPGAVAPAQLRACRPTSGRAGRRRR